MLDDYSPPVKRLKLQPNNRLSRDLNNNKENIDPKCVVTCQHEVVRKRKIPVRRPMQPNLLDLNTDVLLEIVDYLPVAGSFIHSTNYSIIQNDFSIFCNLIDVIMKCNRFSFDSML